MKFTKYFRLMCLYQHLFSPWYANLTMYPFSFVLDVYLFAVPLLILPLSINSILNTVCMYISSITKTPNLSIARDNRHTTHLFQSWCPDVFFSIIPRLTATLCHSLATNHHICNLLQLPRWSIVRIPHRQRTSSK
jgi:hypothetical protein